MASKFKPGIPDNFSFNVAPVADLGDYLDEPAPTPPPRREPPARKEPPPVVTRPRQQVEEAPVAAVPPAAPANLDVQRVAAPATPVAAPVVDAPSERREGRPRGDRHTGPRREINMSPEALHMSDELLDLIRSGSGQRDTKANELMHALLLLAYEVKDEIDPHTLPKRGRWGTPTARAYPLEIKNALLQALRRKHVGG